MWAFSYRVLVALEESEVQQENQVLRYKHNQFGVRDAAVWYNLWNKSINPQTFGVTVLLYVLYNYAYASQGTSGNDGPPGPPGERVSP